MRCFMSRSFPCAASRSQSCSRSRSQLLSQVPSQADSADRAQTCSLFLCKPDLKPDLKADLKFGLKIGLKLDRQTGFKANSKQNGKTPTRCAMPYVISCAMPWGAAGVFSGLARSLSLAMILGCMGGLAGGLSPLLLRVERAIAQTSTSPVQFQTRSQQESQPGSGSPLRSQQESPAGSQPGSQPGLQPATQAQQVETKQTQITQTQARQVQEKQARSQTPKFVVVYSDDNENDWEEIEERLNAAGIDYQVVNWDRVKESSDLTEIDVLFLPNVQEVSRQQMAALQGWLNRGGQLILAGQFAAEASSQVQRELRTLIGMEWLEELPNPVGMRLLPTQCDRDPACDRGWMPSQALDRIPGAGVLSLSGGDSQAAAAWQVPGNSTAIGVSPRVLYLGWEWGEHNRAFDADVAWIASIMQRYGDAPLVSPTVRPNTTPDNASNSAPDTAPNDATTPTVRPTISPTVRPTVRPNVRPTVRPSISPSVTPSRSGATNTNNANNDDNLVDLNVAPVGLHVEPGDAPISEIEALKMQRELTELTGRVHSALRAAQGRSAQSEAAQREMARSGTSSEFDRTALASSPEYVVATLPNTADAPLFFGAIDSLEQARTVLNEFPGLVAAGQYAEARDRWLAARQALLNSYPIDVLQAQPEVRAIWLDRGTIVEARDRAGLERLFDRLAAMGINTVFFETINAGYPIYPSNITRQNPLTRTWNPLAAAVELAHARNMELHAWIWAFAVGNEAHNRIVGDPIDYPGPILEQHPEWANVDDQGRVRNLGSGKMFLDPANAEARWFVLRLIDEIVQNYDVDGVQLDYIRYPFQDPGAERTYGYGVAGRQQFQALTGVDPLTISPRDRQLWAQWTQFREDNVTQFVREVREWLDTRRPEILLSTSVFAYSTHERIHKLQQHWEAWIEDEIVDMVVLMSYAPDTNRLERLIAPLLATPSPVPIIPSVRLQDLDPLVVMDQLQAIRDLPTTGYALFATAALSEPIEQVLRNTQGITENGGEQTGAAVSEDAVLLPQRSPFAMAYARYQALEQEWRSAVTADELWLSPGDFLLWQGHTLMLSEALKLLAAEPNPTNFAVARSLLADYQLEFANWLELQTLRDRYQVQTWQNRLISLEILLDYGDRQGFTADR